MPKQAVIQTSFNAGEFSPRMEGRTDLQKYPSACRTMENFIPLVQGGAIKRSGTRFVKEVKDSADPTRLIPFEFNTEQAYVLEFGDQYMRVYMNGEAVTEAAVAVAAAPGGVSSGTPVVVTTSVAHGYANGDLVFVDGNGVPDVDGSWWVVQNKGASDFELAGSTGSITGGGGTVEREVILTTSPYAAADVGSIAYTQSADVLYLAHQDYPPHKVERTGHAAWTITEIDFDWPTFEDENLDIEHYIVASSGVVGASVTLFSNKSVFTAQHIGLNLKLSELVESNNPEWQPGKAMANDATGLWWSYGTGTIEIGDYVQYEGNVYELIDKNGPRGNTGDYAPVHRSGAQIDGLWAWKYLHSGDGYVEITAVASGLKATATVKKVLPASVVGYTTTGHTFTSANPISVALASHALENDDLIYIYGSTAGTALSTYLNDTVWEVIFVAAGTFELKGSVGPGGPPTNDFTVVRIASGATAIQALSPHGRVTPNKWSFGAWGDTATTGRGYPRAVAFFEDRLWWGGSAAAPQTVWGSRTGRYEDYEQFDEADASVQVTFATDQVNLVEYLSPGTTLVAGTAGGEFVIGSTSDAEGITADTISALRHTTYGARAGVQPVRADNVMLFVQRAGRKMRQFVYDFDTSSYTAPDMTIMSDHIALGLIYEMAYQQEPNRIIWCVLEDGSLIALTFERSHDVIGWHRHVLGGTDVLVESVAVIMHPDGDRQQVWFVVSRTIDGGTKRYIEYMEQEWLRGEAIENSVFLDSSLTYTGAPAATFSGLDHLEGETVKVLADGVVVPDEVVAGGSITLAASASTVTVGIGYTATLETMRLDAGSRDGSAQGKIKRITGCVLRLDQTGRGIFYGPNTGSLDEFKIEDGELFDGDTTFRRWPGGYEQEARVVVQHVQPLPCTIIALMPQLETEDR